ncbi:MAG TPA: endolytic transglycosylase MltG [Cellulomonas sp.]
MSDLFLGTPMQEHREPTPSRRSRHDDKNRRAHEKRQRRRRTIIVLTLAIALVGGAGYVVWSVVGGLFDGDSGTETVSDYPGPGHGDVQVQVAPGDTGAAIGATLEENGVVATASAFTAAYAANPSATSIQPGTYSMMLEMRASDAVNALLNIENRVSYKVTIPEGFTVAQIYDKIYEVTTIPVADLQAAAADTASIGLPAEANGNVEGWLFPSTYLVEPDATATSVLSQMTAKTVEVLTAKAVPNDQWQTVIIKASIVEREGKSAEDRAKIAQAIDNRIAQEMPLQIDATVSYGLGTPGVPPTTAQTRDSSNPYNTYEFLGLPPGPIASPGEVSIDAVLNPTPGDWLFWVTVNLTTGETLFANNLDDHNANVDKLREWQAANQ